VDKNLTQSGARIFGVISMVLAAQMAQATIACSGSVGYLGLSAGGDVAVASGTVIHTICSATSQGAYQINTQACRLFYATLLSNRLAGRQVTIYYNDPTLTSCSQIGQWSSQPSAYFVEQAG
jgi:hypothetical protein